MSTTQADAPTHSRTLNGVDLARLGATVEAIQADPSLARFQFRAHTDWMSGGHSRTRIQGFHGAGTDDDSREAPFLLEDGRDGYLEGLLRAERGAELVVRRGNAEPERRARVDEAGLVADDLRVGNDRITLEADGTIATGAADFDYELVLSDLALVSPQAFLSAVITSI